MKYSKLLKTNKVLILLFHGVVKKKYHRIWDPARKHVTLRRFENIIKDLKLHGNSISMKDFCLKRNLKKNNFIITFDDGFYNNLNAAKILIKYKVHSTFYITTNFIEKNLMSWTDMIDYAVNLTKKKKLLIFKKIFTLKTIKDKMQFQKKIRKIVKNDLKLNELDIAKYIQLNLIGKVINSSSKEIYKKLKWKNIIQLNKNKLFDIGLHSHNHEILTKLDDKELKNTIISSKKTLKKRTKIVTNLFAYPDGKHNHYSSKVIKTLKKFKFISSPTAIKGYNKILGNKFNLKRYFAK